MQILKHLNSQRVESHWFWVDTGPRDPAVNMAFDQALLENAPQLSAPILRFYGWNAIGASFGYFQHFEEISRMTPLRPLVRRPTGGGLVLHDHDWTYSVVCPPNHGWFKFSARESYLEIHRWLARALERAGISTELCPTRISGQGGVCFSGAEVSDVLENGLKVAGAAQRRNNMGLLIQGSMIPSQNWPPRDCWQQAMRRVMEVDHGVTWISWIEDASFQSRVRELTKSKFGAESFIRKR